jgi:hypothetical protein
MGILINERSGQRVILRANHVFGRQGARCDTWLQDQEVSRLHAVIRWSVGRWFVVDQSRNGSLLDGERLPAGQSVPLTPGQQLRFGPAETSAWRVADIGPPVNALVPVNHGLAPIALTRHNLLPSAADPELSVYEVESGQWIVDDAASSRPLGDGETVMLGGQPFRLQLAFDTEPTRTSLDLGASEPPLLAFDLSLDEEHTRLRVLHAGHETDLGERSHHYCLVTLARKRLADARAGHDPAAQGWLDSAQLAKMLGIEASHLNIQIYRARDQLMGAVPTANALAQAVERRRGGLRLGGRLAFEVRRGTQLEGSYRPPRAGERAQVS